MSATALKVIKIGESVRYEEGKFKSRTPGCRRYIHLRLYTMGSRSMSPLSIGARKTSSRT